MKAALFPGQGSQFIGMAKDLYTDNQQAKSIIERANEILGFRISDIMFDGPEEELKQTNITQPAIFIHSMAALKSVESEVFYDVVAGHSLGEFSALVANDCLSFEDGLLLVQARANAMQDACEKVEGTMAAILGLENEVVENICDNIEDIVKAANYNCPGQIVISGSVAGVQKAVESAKEKGARRALILNVRGAFHSELMKPAEEQLSQKIESTAFKIPKFPIYQNVNAQKEMDPKAIKENLIKQLTAPVKWTQIMERMIEDGLTSLYEFGGNGKTISGFMRRVNREITSESYK